MKWFSFFLAFFLRYETVAGSAIVKYKQELEHVNEYAFLPVAASDYVNGESHLHEKKWIQGEQVISLHFVSMRSSFSLD